MNYGRAALKKRAHGIDAKSVKIRRKIGVILLKLILVSILVTGCVGVCTVVGAVEGILSSAPDVSEMDVIPTGYSTTVLARDGSEIAKLVAAGSNRKYVTLDEIPEDLQHAVVAIEDSRFYEHNGIDLKGIARALIADIKAMDTSQGASTITQQLVKNNVLSEQWANENDGKISKLERLERQVQRKIQEMYIAVELEKKINDKDWILENYLNSINLGSNTLGVEAAAERYFGKSVSELTLSECTVIAGITKNPAGYNPILHPQTNADRRKLVLNEMKEQGYITEEQYEEALADDVYDRISEHNDIVSASMNTYFVDAVIDDVAEDLVEKKGYSESDAYKAIYQGGLTIRSTQDLNVQKICDQEAANPDNYVSGTKYSFFLSFQVKKKDGSIKTYTNQTMLSYYKEKYNNQDYSINFNTKKECKAAIRQYEKDVREKGDKLIKESEYIFYTVQPQIAMTIMDQSTGEVRAIVGGRGKKAGNRTWNRATKTCRQPGSTFKIIACYAPALDAGGKTLASVQDDAPFTVGSKTYNNYDFKYRGYTNIRTAITNSINIVTVKTLQDIGVDLGFAYAKEFGFTTLDENDRNLGLSLGGLTNGVKNLELTAAYAAIANEGEYIEPSFYTQVLDHDGNVILDNTQTKDRHQVLQKETAWLVTDAMKDVMTSGTGTRAYFGTKMAQAGKSGTTTANRDALFAGFTPYYTCVVWGGYDDNSKQAGGTTGYPKNLWRSVMSRIHADLEPKDFTKPKGITQKTVCKKSGLLPRKDVCDKDPRGSQNYKEYFAKDALPQEQCDHHIVLSICKESGEIAGEYCPEDQVQKKIFIVDAQQGSADYKYCASKKLQDSLCSIHDENYVPPESGDDGEPDDGEPDDEEDPDDGQDPGETPAEEEPGEEIPGEIEIPQ
ncbi:MAG: PBP1A family penicillin-binding protein [Lachnospiraceae bacterium]|nr:PBP1A family penicillin-binding protein [Lachnospiraceae bacterium]